MKIKNCLEVSHAVSHPLLRKEPEKSWILAYRNGFIPEMLYKFYINMCVAFFLERFQFMIETLRKT